MKGRCFPKIYFSRIKKCIAFLVFAFFSINLYSATCTWTGAEDSDWENGDNWEDGSAPTQNDDVVFSATVTNAPEFTSVTGDIEVGSFDTTNLSGGLDFLNHKFIIHGALNKTVDFENVETLKVFGDYTDTSTSTTDIKLILDFSENDEITVDLGSANFSSIVVENAAGGKVLNLQGGVIENFQMMESGGAKINFTGDTTISENFSISGSSSSTENLIVSGSGTIKLSLSTETSAEYLKFSNASGLEISGTELIVKNSFDENDVQLNFPKGFLYLGDKDTFTWIGEGSDNDWNTLGNLKPTPDYSSVDWTNGSVNVIIGRVDTAQGAPTLPRGANFSSFIVKDTLGSDDVSVNVSDLTVTESFKNSGIIKVSNGTIDLQGTVENAGTFKIDGSTTFTFDSSETKKISKIIFSGTGTINLSSDLYISKITIASDSDITFAAGSAKIFTDEFINKGTLTVESGAEIYADSFSSTGTTTFDGTLYTTNFSDETTNNSTYEKVFLGNYGGTSSSVKGNDSADRAKISELKTTDEGDSKLPDSVEFIGGITVEEIYIEGTENKFINLSGSGKIYVQPAYNQISAAYASFQSSSSPTLVDVSTDTSDGISGIAKKSTAPNSEFPAGWEIQKYKWIGTNSSDWNTADNWETGEVPGEVPDEFSIIIIPDVSTLPFYPIISESNFEIAGKSLEIQVGGKLEISTDCTLSIVDVINSGEIEISAGKTTFTGTFENETDGEISGAGSIRFKGDFTNTGSVSIINLEIEKDFSDTGSWDNDEITIKFNGTNEQTATFGSTTEIGTGTGTGINYPKIIIDNDATTYSELKCVKLTVNEGKTFTGAGIKVSDTLTNGGTITANGLELSAGLTNNGTINSSGDVTLSGNSTNGEDCVIKLTGAANFTISSGNITSNGTIKLETGTFYVPNYKGKGAIKTGGTIHLSGDNQMNIETLVLSENVTIEDHGECGCGAKHSIEIENIDYNSHDIEIKTHRLTKIPGGTGAKDFTVTSGEVEITSDINLSGNLKVTSDSGTAGKISTETKITVGGNLTVESDAEISTNAEIEAGGDLTVASGGKIISTDSEITVGGNLEVASGGQITTKKITVAKNFKDESSGTDTSSYGEVIINLSGGTNSEIETASDDIIETLKITSRGNGNENSIEFKSNLTLQEFLMVGESDNKLTSKGDVTITLTLPASYNEKVAARFVHFDFGPKLSFVDSSGDEYCFAQSCTSSTDGTNPGEYKYPDRWEGLDGERWTGNKDEKWNDDENWVGFVPVDGIKVTIPNGCANYPDAKLESALSLAKLTIESGASINLCSGTLSLISTGSDDVLVNDGTFTISGDGVLKISKWTPASSGSDFKLKENATFEYVGSDNVELNVELNVEVETTNDDMVTIKNGDASATLTVDFTTPSNPNVKFDGGKIETATENFGAIQNDATLTLNATSSIKVNGKLKNNGELKLENDLTISGDFENNGKLQSTGDLTISGETTNASTATLEIENLTLKNSLENSGTITAKKVFFDISSDINLYSGSSDSNKFPPVEFSGTAGTITLEDDLYSEKIEIKNGVTFSAEQDKNIFTKDFINLGKVSIEGKLSTVTLTDETTNGSTYSEVALWNYGDINAFITGVTGDGTENCLAISKLTTDTSSLPKSVKIVGAISVTEIFIQGESISNKIKLKNSGTIYVPAKYTKISAQYVKFEGSDFPVLRDKENPTSSENILGIPFECESDASGNYPDGWHLGFIWNGKTNIEWHEDSNWENGAYPRASNSLNALIIIPKVEAGNYPEISASTNLPLLSSVEIYVREEASLSVTSQIEFRDSLISNDGDINLSENCAISKTASGSGVLKNSGNINLSSSSTVLDLQAEAENSGEIKVGEGTLKFISFDSNAVGKIFVQGGGVKYSGSDSYTLPENTTLSISPSDVATKIYGVSDSSLQKTFEISNMIFDGTGNFDLQTFGNVIINSALGNKIGELVVSPDSVENAGELILKKSGTVKKLLVKENALIKTETDSDFVVTEELLNNGKADFSKITIYKDVTNTNENDDAFKSTDFYISGTDVSVITGVFKFTNLKIENDSLSEIKVVKFPASDRINLPGIQVSGNFSVLGKQLSSGEKNIFLTAQGSPSEDDTTWWYLESASRVNVLDAKIGYAYSKYNIARFVVNCEELVDAVTSVELTRNWFMKIIPSTIHIKMSLSPIGQNKLFVMFDEPIETEKLSHIDEFGNDYYLNAMEDYPNAFGIYELKNGQGLPASEVDIKVDSDVPAKLVFTNEKSTGLELTLTREVTFDDIKNFYVVIKTGYEKYLQPLSSHALSDFAINLLNPLYIYDDEVMKSGVSETSDRPSGVAREWDEEQRNFGTVLFDEGNLHLIASVNDDAKISAADKFMVRAFFDNSPDSGAVSKNLENILSKSFRVWLPEISGVSPFKPISEKLNSNFKSTDGILLNSKNIYDGFDFTVSKGFEWKSGNQVSFLFGVLDEFGEMVKIDSEPEYDEDSEIYTIVQDFPIFALRLKNNSDITSLDLWSFKLQQAMYQRGGVTILSNVVNPLKGGKTTIKIENPSSARVDVIVMTLDGNIVTYLNRGNLPAGTQTFTWDGRNQNGKPVARGIYFVRILGNGFDETRKVMIVK